MNGLRPSDATAIASSSTDPYGERGPLSLPMVGFLQFTHTLPDAMLTPDTCFDCPTFCAFWDAVEAIHCRGWDDGPLLDLLLDHYHNGDTVEETADAVLEADEIGRAEYWMGIPSWA